MQKLVFVAVSLLLVVILVVPGMIGAASVDIDEIKNRESMRASGFAEDFLGRTDASLSPRAPGSSRAVIPQQTFGDPFNDKAIIVHQDDSTFLDDLLFTAAVPAAVHWEGYSRSESLIISDTKDRENGNLLGDYVEYQRRMDATTRLDFIGDVQTSRQNELSTYFSDLGMATQVTDAADVYQGSADIAQYYWLDRRQIGTDTAVLAYVPEADGGAEVYKDSTGTTTGQFTLGANFDSRDVSWVRFFINWTDPGADTDYRIGINDPYAAHNLSYINNCGNTKTNPTNNMLYKNYGHNDVGMSPYYAYQPYDILNPSGPSGSQSFSGNIPAPGDNSLFPVDGASDLQTLQFGPVEAGQVIFIRTQWTYYVNTATDYRDFDTYLYGPGDDLNDDYLAEFAYWHYASVGTTPEYGCFVAPEDGMYNVTVHAYNCSTTGDFYTSVNWYSPTANDPWYWGQVVADSDPVEYHFQEYSMAPDEMVESVTNAAVVASLKNIPLLYTAGGTAEGAVTGALDAIGVKNLIIIDPAGMIDNSTWATAGYTITDHVATDVDVFNYIYEDAKSQSLDKALVLTPRGGPWFAGAALSAAWHAAPVPLMDGPGIEQVLAKATTTWWEMIQFSDVHNSAAWYENDTPKRSVLEGISDDFYSWLGGFNPDYSPLCGDADQDGVPDNLLNWDYSDDVDIVIISPQNAIKPVLDRAINGKASVGRIPGHDVDVVWSLLNRQMLYWKIGYSNGTNPHDPNDQPPVDYHWNRAMWTYITYTHDDGLLDHDAGDEIDDDWCGIDDGGAVHIGYKNREELPAAAAASGRSSEFHTYYDNVKDTLEGGTAFWSFNCHGHHNYQMETGCGVTALYPDAADRPWITDPANADIGFVNPSTGILQSISGEDWYYEMDNTHSPYILHMCCHNGGSRMPEYYMRQGAIAFVGSAYVEYADPAPVFSDRLTRGLFQGQTFGESHRWGLDESADLYSMDDPCVPDKYIPIDNVDANYGACLQTYLYGDPSLRLIAPTLWIDSQWKIDEDSQNMNISITVRNQSGALISPSTFNVVLDNPYTFWEESTGRYRAMWPVDLNTSFHSFTVTAQEPGYVTPEGSTFFMREYDFYIPRLNGTTADVQYEGNSTQTITTGIKAFYPFPLSDEVVENNANYVKVHVYKDFSTSLDVTGDLAYGVDSWVMSGLNVSSLPEGSYFVLFEVCAKHYPRIFIKGGSFSVKHILWLDPYEIKYKPEDKMLDIFNIKFRSSFFNTSIMGPADFDNGPDYHLLFYDDGYTENSAMISDAFDYLGSGEFGALNLSVSSLDAGYYYARLSATPSFGEKIQENSPWFTIGEPLKLTEPTLVYTAGNTQTVELAGMAVTTWQEPAPLVKGQVRNATYRLMESSTAVVVLNGDLSANDTHWGTVLNVSSVSSGDYYLEINFDTYFYGSVNTTTTVFGITQVVGYHSLQADYSKSTQTVDIYGINAWSSYQGARYLDDLTADVHTYTVRQYGEDPYLFVTGGLEYRNGSWEARGVDVSSLPEGECVIYASFSFRNTSCSYQNTPRFWLDYDLVVPKPSVRYDVENDTLFVYDIDPYCADPEIGNVTPATAKFQSRIQLYNSTGFMLYQGDLKHGPEGYHYEFEDILKSIEEGIVGVYPLDMIPVPADHLAPKNPIGPFYVDIMFSTEHNLHVTNTSDPFDIKNDTVPDDDVIDDDVVDDDDDDDSILDWGTGGAGMICFVIVTIVFVILILVMAVLLIIVNKRREKQSRDGGKSEEMEMSAEEGEPPLGDKSKAEEVPADDDDWGDAEGWGEDPDNGPVDMDEEPEDLDRAPVEDELLEFDGGPDEDFVDNDKELDGDFAVEEFDTPDDDDAELENELI